MIFIILIMNNNRNRYFLPYLICCLVSIAQVAISNVAPLDNPTIKLVFEKHTPALFILAPSSDDDNPRALYEFHNAADLYYQHNPRKSPENIKEPEKHFLFVLSDPNDGLYTYDRLRQILGLEHRKCQIVYLGANGQKYRYGYNGYDKINSEITSGKIIQFLHQIQNKQLPIYYKSEVDPQNKNKNQYVTKLAGNKFKQFVENSKQELFCLFYLPLCYKSRVLRSQFHKTAESLQKNQNIKFVEVDISKNEILWPLVETSKDIKKVLDEKSAPLLYLFLKDKSKSPVQYKALEDYADTYDYLIKWIKQQTQYDWVRNVDVSDIFQEDL